MKKACSRPVPAAVLALFAALLIVQEARGAAPWWDAHWQFRLPVRIGAAGYAREEKPAEITVNFTQVIAATGESGEFSRESIRVIEVDSSGAVVSDTVAFQFDPDPSYNPWTQASGTLVIMMAGQTEAARTREFHVYFGLAGGTHAVPPVRPRLTLTDSIPDEGQLSYRIDTEQGSWYYHKWGAGYSSLVDRDGNDWINYHPTYPGSTAGGPSRGIPNCVYPRGYFHPGSTNSTSSIVAAGPLKITISSTANADGWACRWELFARYARLTVLSGDSTYWLLYEGTPGGTLDMASDRVVRSDGTQWLVSESWIQDAPGDEWLYFQDPAVGRSLFMAHHTNDDIYDSYRPMDSLMTVFGFGRQRAWSYLTQFPTELTVGLVDGVSFASTAAAITGAYKPLSVTQLPAERNTLPGTPVPASPASGSLLPAGTVTLAWHPAPLTLAYTLQVAEDSLFAGPLRVNDSTVVDTVRAIAGLDGGRTYFWRVRGRNASGPGLFSPAQTFSIEGVPPGAVLLEAPADLAPVSRDSVLFRWRAADADRYWFELGYDQTFLFHQLDSTLTDTVTVVRGLVASHQYFWRVRARNGAGWGPFGEVRSVVTSLTAAAEEGVPRHFRLEQNYPNPFNPVTAIRFEIPERAHVLLRVYSVLGEELSALADGVREAGSYTVEFDASSLPSGVYICRLQAGTRTAVRRMALVR